MKTLELDRSRETSSDHDTEPERRERDHHVARKIARKATANAATRDVAAPNETASPSWSFGDAINAGIHPIVERAAESPGHALPDGLRAKFEASLATDLGGVRVHSDTAAADASAALGARAYAVGQDVFVGANQYAPETTDGAWLLAHEVAHTVQQRGASASPQYKLEVSEPGDAMEVEADAAAHAMIEGRAAQVTAAGGIARIARETQGKKAAAAPTADAAWWSDDDALADFMYKFARYAHAAQYGAPDAISFEGSTRANNEADQALMRGYWAALGAAGNRAGNMDPTSSINAAAVWRSTHEFVDRVARARSMKGGDAEGYNRAVEEGDRYFTRIEAEAKVQQAREGASFEGNDTLLLAHKDVIIKALESAKDTCAKLEAAAKENARKVTVEVGGAANKGAGAANGAVANEPTSGETANQKQQAAQGHYEVQSGGAQGREVALAGVDMVLLVLKAPDVGEALKNAKGPLEKIKAIGQLFQYAIDVATSAVTLTMDAVALIVSKSMPQAAGELCNLSKTIKSGTAKWMGRAMTLFNLATGIADLVDAIRKGDDEAAIRAGGSIIGAVVGFGASALKMGAVYGAFLTIYVQELTEGVIAIGKMGAALEQAKTNKAIEQVSVIAKLGVELARSAAALQVAFQGMSGARDQTETDAYQALFQREVDPINRTAANISGAIQNLTLAQERGGVVDGARLAASIGSDARDALFWLSREKSPSDMIPHCGAALAGITTLVRLTLAIRGTMSEDKLMNGGMQEIAQ